MSDIFRVIIAGGRDFSDYGLLTKFADACLRNKAEAEIEIVCGKARGADTLGERYAIERGFRVKYFPADWDHLGKSAGFIRNRQMADYADALIAFWDGKSRGTASMIQLAKAKGIPYRICRY